LSLHDGGMTRRVLIGLDPLRESRGFRLLFLGQLIGVAGGQLTAVAVPYQVYLETRSSLQIGLVGLVQLVPLMLGALIGGALGDVFDRRRILAVCSVAVGACSGVLALNACAAHPPIAVLYLASALNAGFGGALSAVCGAALPALVEPHRLVAANAVMQVVDQVGMVAAPALAGLLIATIALPWIYALAAAAYLAMAPILARMPRFDAASVEAGAGDDGGGEVGEPEVRLSTFLRETVGGLRYLRGRQLIQGAFLRSERDGVRDAQGAVPGLGRHRIRGRRRPARLSLRRTGRRRAARRDDLGLARADPAPGPRGDRGGVLLGRRDHALRPRPRPMGRSAAPRPGRLGGRSLGGAARHDPATRGGRLAPRPDRRAADSSGRGRP
jgi:hypothetical protein